MVNYLMTAKEPDLQTSVCGLVVIQDIEGMTMSHMSTFSASLGKKMITIMQVGQFKT